MSVDAHSELHGVKWKNYVYLCKGKFELYPLVNKLRSSRSFNTVCLQYAIYLCL